MLYDLNIRQSRAHWAPSVAMASRGWRLETSAALSIANTQRAGSCADMSPTTRPSTPWGLLPRVWHVRWVRRTGHWFVQASTGFSDPTNFESLSTDARTAPCREWTAGPNRPWTLETGAASQPRGSGGVPPKVGSAIVQVDSKTTPNVCHQPSFPVTMQGVEWQSADNLGCTASGPCAKRMAQFFPQLGRKATCRDRRSGWPTSNTIGPFGIEPHVDASNVDARGGCHAAQLTATVWCIPPVVPQPTCRVGMDANHKLALGMSVCGTPPTRPILGGINSMGFGKLLQSLLLGPGSCLHVVLLNVQRWETSFSRIQERPPDGSGHGLLPSRCPPPDSKSPSPVNLNALRFHSSILRKSFTAAARSATQNHVEGLHFPRCRMAHNARC